MRQPQTGRAPRPVQVERERLQFRRLIAGNPNYFGNLPNSPFEPVQKIIQNTTYEEITCVGYNLERSQLEATVQIKRPTGYSGDLCSNGSIEYVRFFLDYGGGWEDQGVVGFNVHDIPNSNDCNQDPTKPLSYVASLKIDPKRRVCRRPVLPRVRAILSWQVVPPPDPNYPPVWGNVFEDNIQIKPYWRNLAAVLDQIAVAVGQQIEIPEVYQELVDIPIPLPDPPDPPIAELAQLYATGARGRAAAVEPHRFGLPQIHAAMNNVAIDQNALVATAAEW
jgi:hypothetical protein